MKKIIGIIHPFDIYQTFYVVKDGNEIIDEIHPKIDEVPNEILFLSQQYNIYNIDLTGVASFN